MFLRTRDHHASRDHTFKMLFGGLWCGTCLHEVPRPAGRLHMRVKAALVDHPHERGRLLPDLLSHLRRADIPMIAVRVLDLSYLGPELSILVATSLRCYSNTASQSLQSTVSSAVQLV